MPILEEPREQSIRDIARKIKKHQPDAYEKFIQGLVNLARKVQEDSGYFFTGLDAITSIDLDEVYGEYVKQLGKDELTDQEKRQAIINHVLRE